jgi:hypothetical protein
MKAIDHSEMDCTVCQVTFSLALEGGCAGEFGILPVAFCPTCLSSAVDMVHQLEAWEDDEDGE